MYKLWCWAKDGYGVRINEVCTSPFPPESAGPLGIIAVDHASFAALTGRVLRYGEVVCIQVAVEDTARMAPVSDANEHARQAKFAEGRRV